MRGLGRGAQVVETGAPQRRHGRAYRQRLAVKRADEKRLLDAMKVFGLAIVLAALFEIAMRIELVVS